MEGPRKDRSMADEFGKKGLPPKLPKGGNPKKGWNENRADKFTGTKPMTDPKGASSSELPAIYNDA